MAEEIGVRGSFDEEDFNKGLEKYIAALAKAEAATQQTVDRLNNLGASISGLTDATPDVNKAAASIGTLAKNLNSLTGFNAGASPIATFIDGITEVLSRFGRLKTVDTSVENLTNLSNSLQTITKLKLNATPLTDFLTTFEEGIRKIGNLKNIGSAQSTFDSLVTTVASLSANIGNVGLVVSVFDQLADIKPINSAAISSLIDLSTTVAAIGQIANIGETSKQIGTLGNAMVDFGKAKVLDQGAIDQLAVLGDTLLTLGQISDIGSTADSIRKVSLALSGFAGITGIPQDALDSLTQIGVVLQSISAIGDVDVVGKTFGQLSTAMKTFAGVTGIPQNALDSLDAIGVTLSNFNGASGAENAVDNLAKLSRTLGSLGKIVAVPQSALDTLDQLKTSLEGISQIGQVAESVASLGKLVTALNRLSGIKAIDPTTIPSLEALSQVLIKLAATPNLDALATTLQNLNKGINSVGTAATESSPQITSFSQSLSVGLGVAIGEAAIGVLHGIADAIVDLGQSAIDTVVFFEKFKTSLNFKLANESGIPDMQAAMAATIPMAEALNHSLENLAIKSFFSVEEVDSIFQTATGFGFASDQALRLTHDMADLSAGAGITTEKIDRIVYALGQINTEGHVTTLTLRHIGQASVEFAKILGEALGKTQEEIKGMVTDGAIPAQQAMTILADYIERKMGGAAERAASTVGGLVTALGDIGILARRDFFTEAFKPLQPVLQKLVNFFVSDNFRASVTALGQLFAEYLAVAIDKVGASINYLLAAFASISPSTLETIFTFGLIAAGLLGIAAAAGIVSVAVVALANPFGIVIAATAALLTAWVQNFDGIQTATYSVLSTIGQAMNDLASEAISWGSNIAESLAVGISSAVSVVLDALNTIGDAITYFLQPGSPPRLLPELDQWGTDAATVYLEGWSKADFSALDTLGSLLETHIKNLVSTGDIDEKNATSLIIGSRQQVAEALNQLKTMGSVSSSIIGDLSKLGQIGVDTLTHYFNSFSSVTHATQFAANAQQALNDKIASYDALLNPLKNSLKAVTDAQSFSADEATLVKLRRTLANQGITDAKRQTTQLAVSEILLKRQIATLEDQKSAAQSSGQTQVDVANNALTAAKDQLDLFQSQVAEQTNINSLLATQAQLLQRLAKSDALAARKKEKTALEEQLKAVQLQAEEMQDLIKAAKDKYIISKADSTEAEKMTAQLDLQVIAVRQQQRALEATKLGVDLTKLANVPIVLKDIDTAAYKASLKGGGLDDLSNKFKGFDTSNFIKNIDAFKESIKTAREKIDGFIASFAKMTDDLNTKLPSFLKLRDESGKTSPILNTLGLAFSGLFAKFTTSTILSATTSLFPFLEGINPYIGAISLAVGALTIVWEADWLHIREHTADSVKTIQTEFKKLTGTNGLSDVYANLQTFFSKVSYLFNHPTGGGTSDKERDYSLNSPLEIFMNKNFGTNAVDSVIKKYKKNIDDWSKKVHDSMDGSLQAELDKPGISKTDTFTIYFGKLFGQGLGGGIHYVIGTVLPNLMDELFAVFKFLFLGGWARLISDWLIDTSIYLYQHAHLIYDWVSSRLDDADKKLNELFDFMLGRFGLFLLVIKEVGRDVWKGLVEGMEELKTKSGDRLNAIWQSIVDSIKKFFGISSPSTLMHDGPGADIGAGLIDGIIDYFPSHIKSLTDALGALADSVFSLDTIHLFTDKALGLGKSILDSIGKGIAAVKESSTWSDWFGSGLYAPSADNAKTSADEAVKQVNTALNNVSGAVDTKNFKATFDAAIAAFAQFRTSALDEITLMQTGILRLFDDLPIIITPALTTLYIDVYAVFHLIHTQGALEMETLHQEVTTSITAMNDEAYLQVFNFYNDTLAAFIDLELKISGEGGVVPTMVAEIVQFFTDLANGVSIKIQEMIKNLMDLLTGQGGLIEKLQTDFVSKGEKLGSDFGDGIAKGILDKIEKISKAAAAVVNAAFKSAQDEMAAHSPSERAADELGDSFTAGIGKGMLRSMDSLLNTTRHVTNGMFNAANLANQRLGSGQNNVRSYNSNRTNIYQLTVNSGHSMNNLRQQFGIMEVMV